MGEGLLFDKTGKIVIGVRNKLVKSIVIPDGVTSIIYYAFEECCYLKSIDIPASITKIEDRTFRDCRSLTRINVDNENLHYLDIDGVLYSKDKTTLLCFPAGNSIVKYNIPTGVASIGNNAFYYCKSLTSIEIPNSVTSIGNYAFGGCTGLTSIDIPNSVTCIGDGAFCGCI
ncbi:MAG: leucine-rich repeat domain-containing protein [Bacteroidales bacterium]|nr:leucine-rich repeat domain-containing protein [Bacteroidales bacterium]